LEAEKKLGGKPGERGKEDDRKHARYKRVTEKKRGEKEKTKGKTRRKDKRDKK